MPGNGKSSSVSVRILNRLIRGVLRLAFRVHDDALSKVPRNGPLIITPNHINSLEVPIVFTHLMPRQLTGYAKAESWDNPIIGWLFNQWEGIPLHRGEADLVALKRGIEYVKNGGMLVIAPEGTRSRTGILQRGHPGAVLIALKSKAPILPMAYYGNEIFFDNIKKFRRTDFYIVVGNQFHLVVEEKRLTGEIRQQIVDEMMYQIAALLPEKYRGVYTDLDQATTRYIAFDSEADNNLLRAKK